MLVEMAELVMVEYLQIGYFFWRELVTLMLWLVTFFVVFGYLCAVIGTYSVAIGYYFAVVGYEVPKIPQTVSIYRRGDW